MVPILIIAAVVVLIILYVIIGYNNLVKLRNNVKEGYATMDVYLKKRFDLIPNLVETVKGYAKHESETLERVISARSNIQSATNTEEKLRNESELSNTLKSLFALGEAYPDLKANSNFVQLQKQLQQIEEDIANARKYYNAVVKELNNQIEMFPSNILSNLFGFKKMPMFETSAEDRENVGVMF